MKLEAGQVWRKPDGTLWTIEALRARHKDAVMRNPGHKPLYVKQLVITETWQRAPHNPSFIHTEPDKLEDEGT